MADFRNRIDGDKNRFGDDLFDELDSGNLRSNGHNKFTRRNQTENRADDDFDKEFDEFERLTGEKSYQKKREAGDQFEDIPLEDVDYLDAHSSLPTKAFLETDSAKYTTEYAKEVVKGLFSSDTADYMENKGKKRTEMVYKPLSTLDVSPKEDFDDWVAVGSDIGIHEGQRDKRAPEENSWQPRDLKSTERNDNFGSRAATVSSRDSNYSPDFDTNSFGDKRRRPEHIDNGQRESGFRKVELKSIRSDGKKADNSFAKRNDSKGFPNYNEESDLRIELKTEPRFPGDYDKDLAYSEVQNTKMPRSAIDQTRKHIILEWAMMVNHTLAKNF